MKPEAQRLTTTLYRLRAANACAVRYRHLVERLGGVSFDHDSPINLLTILEHNGVDDCLWALCATEQNCDVVARLMACDFAEEALPLYEARYPENRRPRSAIKTARRYALGEATGEELAVASAAAWAAARDAAWAAARDAAWATASAAARDAARAAASAAARDAARAAAWAAARAAAWDAAWAAQEKIIREYLLPEGAQ